ncbi:MAG: flagellar M-ring protein FliF C-terminal domain-containing protein [Mariniblastus sp.]|nr:flagellar M-ring protein FliF C-terminal domain-containing protein [Mariniblastus sp.]
MQTLKSFLNQSLLIWRDSTGAGRVGIALLLTICVGGIISVGIWSAQPNYVVLARDIDDPTQAAKIMAALDAENITYQIKGSGSMIMVGSSKLSRARIAAGKAGLNSSGSEMEEISPWMDPVSQQYYLNTNLERRLKVDIEKIRSVKSANVHLSIPEKQAFIRQSTDPTASVLIEISHLEKFNEADAAAIADFVASAVPGLLPSSVSVSDTQGNQYSTDTEGMNFSKKEEFIAERESALKRKAENQLRNLFGWGNFNVEVTADYKFENAVQESRELGPEKFLIQENIKQQMDIAAGPASGIAGTGANLVKPTLTPIGSAAVTAANKSQLKMEEQESKWDFSELKRTETIDGALLNALSIAVTINKQDRDATQIAELKTTLESSIGTACGVRIGKDQITVDFIDFVTEEPLDPVATSTIPWDQINEILKNISLGVAALVALFIAFRTFKKFQPDPIVTSEAAAAPTSQLTQLSELVKQNPEVFAKIIDSWASLETETETKEESTTVAA